MLAVNPPEVSIFLIVESDISKGGNLLMPSKEAPGPGSAYVASVECDIMIYGESHNRNGPRKWHSVRTVDNS
jgi:hypothetical protein